MPDMLIRGVPPETAAAMKVAARVRGMTYAEYLERIVSLHTAAKELARYSDTLDAELRRLGLHTVSG